MTITQLRQPFSVERITFKPGAVAKSGSKALGLAYADTRAYQERLDEVFDLNWTVRYTPVSDRSIIAELTLIVEGNYHTRSATGSSDDLPSAEAQAFKRACSAFGLGRYLYELPQVWAEYDNQRKRFTDHGIAQLRSTLDPKVNTKSDEYRKFHELGRSIFGDGWDDVRHRNVSRMTGGRTDSSRNLTSTQLQQLVTGMEKMLNANGNAVTA